MVGKEAALDRCHIAFLCAAIMIDTLLLFSFGIKLYPCFLRPRSELKKLRVLMSPALTAVADDAACFARFQERAVNIEVIAY